MSKVEKGFAQNLKAARGDKTQTEFADFLGIPQQSYSRYERGMVPPWDVLHKIAEKLGIRTNDLLTGTPQQTSQFESAMLQQGIAFQRRPGETEITLGKNISFGFMLAELGKLLDAGMTPAEIVTRLKLSLAVHPRKKQRETDAPKSVVDRTAEELGRRAADSVRKS